MSAPWHGRLSVLLYESSQRMVDTYSRQFVEVFKEAGYPNAHVLGVSPGHRLFSDDALPSRYYFDVVICDASFGDSIPDRVGLQTLTDIKRKHKGIFAIAYTMHPLDYNECVESFEFDLYVNKVALNRADYRVRLADQIKQRLRVNAAAYIAGNLTRIWPGLRKRAQNDLIRIIRKVTYTSPGSVESPGITKVTLVPELSGYSKSRVFYLQAVTADGFHCVQSVLKLAYSDDAGAVRALEEERKNYSRFVRWYLPYYWRPELMAETDEGSMSAICYAVVGSWDTPPRSISQWIKEGRLDVVGKAIESIFSPDFQRWYAPANVRLSSAGEHLESLYLESWIGKASFERHNEVIRRVYSSADVGQRKRFLDDDLLPDRIGTLLFGQPMHAYRTCIVHGDLNTNNVFASLSSPVGDSEMAHVSFIDFANTGRGHVFVDFAIFEVNLRLHFYSSCDHNLEAAIKLEDEILVLGDSVCSPLAAQIRRMRRYAEENFSDEPRENYLYAVAAFAFGLLAMGRLNDGQLLALVGVVARTTKELRVREYWK